MRKRGGRKNNFSARSVPETRQVSAILSCSKSNRKRYRTTIDSSDSSDNNNPADVIIPVNDPSSFDEFIWDDNKRGKREFPFSGTPGIKVQAEDIDSPLFVLKTFIIITKEIVSDIVKYTNSYAEIIINHPKIQERMKQSARGLFHLLEPVTEDDIWVYFNLLVLMGIVNKPTYAMHWCKDHIFSTPIFSRIMRRGNFERIRKMLHFTDPLSEDPADTLRQNYVAF